jgi:hypothetical protein
MTEMKVVEENGRSATEREEGFCECGCGCGIGAARQASTKNRERVRPARLIEAAYLACRP